MAERLTELDCYDDYQILEEDLPKAIDKLGKLEDILEKYGIDIQNLDYILDDYSKNQGRDFAICEEMDDLKKDRDTWKRACKDACEKINISQIITNEEMLKYEDDLKYYFYEQAKQVTSK